MNEVLPNAEWLKANGPNGLAKALKANPELFAHLKQEPSTVSESALVKRVNRKLAAEYERIGINRNCSINGRARYHYTDTYRKVLIGEFDDLESFARETGVLAQNEVVAYE